MVRLENLEIFDKISLQNMAINPDGTLYVLAVKEARVLSFKPDGSKAYPPFAGQGEGPGELLWPRSIQCLGDLVMVADRRGAHIYSKSGEFIGRADLGSSHHQLVNAGSIQIEWPYDLVNDPEARAEMLFFSKEQDYKVSTSIGSYRKLPMEQGNLILSSSEGVVVYKNPAADNVVLTSTPDGAFAFIYVPNTRKIRRFSAKTMDWAGSISLSEPPTFNETWGDLQHEIAMETYPNAREVRSFKPEICPPLRKLRVLDDNIHVVLWSRSPDKDLPVLAYDHALKSIKPRFSGQALFQVGAFFQDSAWVICWDEEEEEAGIVRISLDKLEQFVSQHPIPWK